MCLGIVGQIVAIPDSHPDLARVAVAGLARDINIALLAGEVLQPGDGLLIESGFAMEKIDEETARAQMSALVDYSGADGEPAFEFPRLGHAARGDGTS